MNNQDHIIIGEQHGWGNPVAFGISPADQRQHLYIIGKTGSGKTTLLRNLIVQHIAAGHGVGLIDPHGDLAEELLDHIPPARADHLVYFHPGDLDFPVGLNLLANVATDDRHLVASGIVGAFKGIWRESWGPRLEYLLYNAIAALLDCENTTLLGVNRLLTDDAYRAWVVRQVRDPFIRDFWATEFAGYDERFRREAIAPIQNKLGQFLLNPVIRNILGQVKSKVSIPFVMDNERLFIANLSKGRLGHDKANLLMDVHCSTCGEPWDVYHLWHDAIFETGLSHAEAERWGSLPRAEKLSDRYRKEFQAAGWEFGQGVINVVRCPCCPKGAQPNLARVETKAGLEELMGDDEDGLAATFENYRL